MLVGNAVRLAGGPFRSYGAALAAANDRGTVNPGSRRNGLMAPVAAVPFGYTTGAWLLPQTGGGISSYQRVSGVGTLTATPTGTRPTGATLDGVGSLDATGTLLASTGATLTGEGALSAEGFGVLSGGASLSGAGSLSATAAASAHGGATLSGSGSLSAEALGVGHIGSTIEIGAAGDGITQQQVADAVWGSPQGQAVAAVSRNKVVTDPVNGTYTVYAEDDVTILFETDLWEDADGTTPYSGNGADRRDRLQ